MHQNLILLRVARDDGLGNAQLVDAAFDGLLRLLDGVVAKLHHSLWTHAEQVPSGLRDTLEGDLAAG